MCVKKLNEKMLIYNKDNFNIRYKFDKNDYSSKVFHVWSSFR